MSLEPLILAPLAVQVHAVSALAAVLIGALVLFRRKGTTLHKLLGRAWVVLMLVTATSALWINEIRLIGPFSPIHLFTLLTYGGVFEGLRHIRRGNIAGHRAAMQSLYFTALGLAGAFTLLPGRRMNQMLFGPDAGWTPSLVAIGVVLAMVGYGLVRTRTRAQARGRRINGLA
jgi:uncharacterized membrane protein